MALDARALTLVATCEEELGIEPDEETELLERYIRAATDMIEKYCGRDFYRRTVTEYVEAPTGTALFLRHTPVEALSVMSYGGNPLATSDFVIRGDDGGIYPASGGSEVPLVGFYPWDHNLSRVYLGVPRAATYEVTYVGGYVTPRQAELDDTLTRSLPFDLEQCCVDIVNALFGRRGADKGISAEAIGSANATFGRSSSLIPDPLVPILNRYRVRG